MAFTTTIDLKPSATFLVKNFYDMGEDVKATREPLKRSVQQVLAPSFRQNFDVGGRPTWPSLSEATLQVRESLGYGSDPLVRSGTLERVAGQLNIWTIRGYPQSEAWVSSLPGAEYGAVHQAGASTGFYSTFGDVTIPARPWAVIQPEDVERIREVFANYIDERLALRVEQGGV